MNWDAAHYHFLKDNGYDFGRTAFFPLFPFFWKIINVKPITMGLINLFIFMCSASWMSFELQISKIKHILLISLPGVIFYFLPYSEAIFFVSGTMIVIGLKNKKYFLMTAGLFLCSLTRPTTFIFIPALILTIIISHDLDYRKIIKREIITRLAVLIVVLIIGLLLSFLAHYYYTKVWITFFDAQEIGWGNKLRIPTLPLTTWGGDNINRYDASAFFIGISSAIMILILLFNKTNRTKLQVPDYVLFSMLYLAGTAGVVLLYRGGSLFSLNRFIYSTPFVIVVIHYFIKNVEFSIKKVLYLFLITEFFWMLFASYNHIHNFLCFTIISVFFVILLFVSNKNKWISTGALVLLIIANNIVAFKLLSKFLFGLWVA